MRLDQELDQDQENPRPRGARGRVLTQGLATCENSSTCLAPLSWMSRGRRMCRNIKTLHNFEPPATDEEIRASALQFVRKLSGFTHPSKANEAAFQRAVDEVSDVARRLLVSLETATPPRDRDLEAAKARERSRQRFA